MSSDDGDDIDDIENDDIENDVNHEAYAEGIDRSLSTRGEMSTYFLYSIENISDPL